jgi:shikimate 5-dehydrogenase/shikimate kinase
VLQYVVVAAPPAVRTPEDLERLPSYADLIELRLDLLPGALEPGAVERWIAASRRPVLATVRTRAQGGAFDGTPEAAAHVLLAAHRAGARMVDAEAGPIRDRLCELDPTPAVVLSRHGRVPAPPRRGTCPSPVALLKLALPVATPADLEEARAWARTARHGPLQVVPYGPLGGLRGAYARRDASLRLLYGSADEASAVVEGQPTLGTLLDELRAGEVGPDAALYGLVGRPPARSPSPALHNAVFRSLDREALYLPLPSLDLRAALALPFEGLSVTTPFKEEALRLADEADDAARATGVANTLLRLPGRRLRALNTDVEAVATSVPFATAGETALVYGAGGFARAAVHALRHAGYAVRVGSRDEARGRAFAAATGATWAGPRLARGPRDRVVVNATPLGALGEDPAPLRDFPLDGLVVLDAPYAAEGVETGLVRAAGAQGAERVVGGLDLLLAQARGQARAFTGADADPRVLRMALRPRRNLVLLGHRGAGKTTVGRRVARLLGRPCVDLDEEVERITNRSASSWIREEGLPAFREAEALAVERVADRRGVVIATGGGVLEGGRNGRRLEDRGILVWLRVSPETAAARIGASSERPPLEGSLDPLEEARVLIPRRETAWKADARHVVSGEDPIEVVAKRVADLWCAEIASDSSP